MPMTTAAVREMTTQIMAMRRERLMRERLLMAIKRVRMWGIPK